VNKEKEEITLLNIDRNNLLIAGFFAATALTFFLAFNLLKVFNPWGFIVAIPGAILFFQSIWLFLNPFALVFEDRFEIKQSFIHHKTRYFVDIKKVGQKNKSSLYITFNDDDVEKINLSGIRGSQVSSFKEEIVKKVEEALQKRV
jgi:hypothetical protein